MTTMSGQGACPNAAPVARLQAELEAVEGELELARAAIVALVDENADLQVRNHRLERDYGDAWMDTQYALRERNEARALVPETLVCW